MRLCLSARAHPPRAPRRPLSSMRWLRKRLLTGRTVSGCPHTPVWLKHLSFLSRSIFKPFIFVDDVKLVPKAQSPCFGDDDPAKKEPRFQEKPDRRHELYKAHEWARAVIAGDQVSLRGGRGRATGLARTNAGKQPTSSPFSPCSSTAPLEAFAGMLGVDFLTRPLGTKPPLLVLF